MLQIENLKAETGCFNLKVNTLCASVSTCIIKKEHLLNCPFAHSFIRLAKLKR